MGIIRIADARLFTTSASAQSSKPGADRCKAISLSAVMRKQAPDR
jgi:hypothetical protein